MPKPIRRRERVIYDCGTASVTAFPKDHERHADVFIAVHPGGKDPDGNLRMARGYVTFESAQDLLQALGAMIAEAADG